MLKRIIFDLDNTLFPFLEEYWLTLKETLQELNLPFYEEIQEKIRENVGTYEKQYRQYNEKTMLVHLNQGLSFSLPDCFITCWMKKLEKCVPKDTRVLQELLEYLSGKYELVVLTNWFTQEQKARLENSGLLPYFKEVIGTDSVLNKPNKEAFLKACGNNKPSACIMIGDDLQVDILGALNVGMRALYLNQTNDRTNKEEIKTLKELKERL